MSFWIKLGGILAIILALIGTHEYLKHSAVKEAVAAVEHEYQDKMEAAKQEALRKEKDLRDSQIAAMEKKNEEIKAIDAKLNVALGSLQFYKNCATDNPLSPSSGKACPGRELSREDAEFLIREAARADAVVAERDYYYGRYEAARRALAP